MSKIDDYNKAKDRYKHFLAYARDAKDEHNCDKLGAKINISNTYRGYYGNSGCSSWSDDVTNAVKDWMESHIREALVDIAMASASEAERAKVAARDEAMEILDRTAMD